MNWIKTAPKDGLEIPQSCGRLVYARSLQYRERNPKITDAPVPF